LSIAGIGLHDEHAEESPETTLGRTSSSWARVFRTTPGTRRSLPRVEEVHRGRWTAEQAGTGEDQRRAQRTTDAMYGSFVGFARRRGDLVFMMSELVLAEKLRMTLFAERVKQIGMHGNSLRRNGGMNASRNHERGARGHDPGPGLRSQAIGTGARKADRL
jgi:hypothetical protein